MSILTTSPSSRSPSSGQSSGRESGQNGSREGSRDASRDPGRESGQTAGRFSGNGQLPDVRSTGAFDLAQALASVSDRKSILILTHDNPDPDGLAAAMGLKRLIEHELGIPATIALSGIVGRAENRTMVNLLGIDLVPLEKLNLDAFDGLALVDAQPHTGNSSIPANLQLDVVIDHHPLRSSPTIACWHDVRPDLGATCTIVFEYLKARQIDLSPALATGLFYALKTETRDLGRESTNAERDAYLELVTQVDHQLLFRISHPKVPRAHFSALDRAIRKAQVWGSVVTVNLDALSYPDLVAEVADMLLGFEEAKVVLCCGRHNGQGFLSLRTEPSEKRAGVLIRDVIRDRGTAGGHGLMAGGRLHQRILGFSVVQPCLPFVGQNLLQETDTDARATSLLDPIS